MPRSYSFDHFQVPKTMTPTPERGRKKGASVAKKNGGNADSDLHYGKKFAQTEELYQAHAMEAQLEELAGVAKEKTTKAPKMSRSPDADPIDRMRKSAPIGAMPTAELPGKKKLKDFWADGVRHVQLLKEGTRDILHAASFLIHMPSDIVRSFLHRNRGQEA